MDAGFRFYLCCNNVVVPIFADAEPSDSDDFGRVVHRIGDFFVVKVNAHKTWGGKKIPAYYELLWVTPKGKMEVPLTIGGKHAGKKADVFLIFKVMRHEEYGSNWRRWFDMKRAATRCHKKLKEFEQSFVPEDAVCASS